MADTSTQVQVDQMAAATELTYFTNALRTFVKSSAKFQVVCSLRNNSSSISPLQSPARPRSQVHTLVVLDSSFNPPTVAHMQMAVSTIQELHRRHQQSPQPAALRLLLLLSVNNADKAPKPAPFEHRLGLMLAMARDMHAILKKEEAQPQPEEQQSASLPASARVLDVPIDLGLTSEPYFHRKSDAIAASPFYARPAFESAPDSKETPDQVFVVGYDTLIRIFNPKYYPPPATPIQPADLPDGLPADATPMLIALNPLMRRARLRVTTRLDDQWGDEESQQAWLRTLEERGGAGDLNWASKIELVPGPSKAGKIVSSTLAREAAKTQNWEQLDGLVGPHVCAWIKDQKLYTEA